MIIASCWLNSKGQITDALWKTTLRVIDPLGNRRKSLL
jgi:hypothetical protein